MGFIYLYSYEIMSIYVLLPKVSTSVKYQFFKKSQQQIYEMNEWYCTIVCKKTVMKYYKKMHHGFFFFFFPPKTIVEITRVSKNGFTNCREWILEAICHGISTFQYDATVIIIIGDRFNSLIMSLFMCSNNTRDLLGFKRFKTW